MDFEIEIAEFIAQAKETASEMATGLVESFPLLPAYMPQLFEACVLCLAVALWLLCRRVRRDRAAMRGMATELGQHYSQIVTFERRQNEMEDRLARLGSEIADLHGRQRSMEARVGKPDPQLAVAMARAGTRRQDMVECGLSHGEVHLLHALNAARTPQDRPQAAAGA